MSLHFLVSQFNEYGDLLTSNFQFIPTNLVIKYSKNSLTSLFSVEFTALIILLFINSCFELSALLYASTNLLIVVSNLIQ